MPTTYDHVIVGVGIMGLALARELRRREPGAKICMLEKEPQLGKHQSGRNSGVLHSGIYYAVGSLKGRLCAEGARELAAYCDERSLPIHRNGKVIVPVRASDDPVLDMLYERAKSNGAVVEMIDAARLQEIEPEVRTPTGRALYSPQTAVIDPVAIMERLAAELREQGVEIRFGQRFERVDVERAALTASGETVHYGHLFNAAGLHADEVARAFGVGQQYVIVPFKGFYYRLDPASGIKVNGLVYPVPDMNVPFLGVHFTRKIDGQVYLGPTAIPALGREHYGRFQGLDPAAAPGILGSVIRQYLANKQGFRQYAHEEGWRFFKPKFAEAARALAPRLRAEHLLKSDKSGIRAQLFDRRKGELVMDFLVERGKNSTHVLNAVSPAYTSAFSFAKLVLESRE